MINKRIYLGDSVYAQYDGYRIILTTENGEQNDPSNTIVLEAEVLHNLDHFKKSIINWRENKAFTE